MLSRQIIVGKTRVDVTNRSVSWISGMAIDLDGAPNAYAPHGSGLPALDALANAGVPGKWWGLACSPSGEPYVQRSGRWKGYYVSTTALINSYYPPSDPRRYVDAAVVPYIAVPKALLLSGVQKGDVCLVECGGLSSGAIVADVGPAGKIGEGSPALASALGIPSDRHGGCADGVVYRIFLRSATKPPWPRDAADIQMTALRLSSAS